MATIEIPKGSETSAFETKKDEPLTHTNQWDLLKTHSDHSVIRTLIDNLKPDEDTREGVQNFGFLPLVPRPDRAPVLILGSDHISEEDARYFGRLIAQKYGVLTVISTPISRETEPVADAEDESLDAREISPEDYGSLLFATRATQQQIRSGDFSVIALDDEACKTALCFVEGKESNLDRLLLINPSSYTLYENAHFITSLSRNQGVQIKAMWETNIDEAEARQLYDAVLGDLRLRPRPQEKTYTPTTEDLLLFAVDEIITDETLQTIIPQEEVGVKQSPKEVLKKELDELFKEVRLTKTYEKFEKIKDSAPAKLLRKLSRFVR